jgi:hypothetical protein
MTDATSIDPTQMLSGVLSDPTATLFGLEDEFTVVSVQQRSPAAVKVVVEQTTREGPCPDCGVTVSLVGTTRNAADQGPLGWPLPPARARTSCQGCSVSLQDLGGNECACLRAYEVVSDRAIAL